MIHTMVRYWIKQEKREEIEKAIAQFIEGIRQHENGSCCIHRRDAENTEGLFLSVIIDNSPMFCGLRFSAVNHIISFTFIIRFRRMTGVPSSLS